MQIWRHIDTHQAAERARKGTRTAAAVYLQVCRHIQEILAKMGEERERGEERQARLINRANSGTNLKPVYMATTELAASMHHAACSM